MLRRPRIITKTITALQDLTWHMSIETQFASELKSGLFFLPNPLQPNKLYITSNYASYTQTHCTRTHRPILSTFVFCNYSHDEASRIKLGRNTRIYSTYSYDINKMQLYETKISVWAIIAVSQCENSFEFMFFDKLLRKKSQLLSNWPNPTSHNGPTQPNKSSKILPNPTRSDPYGSMSNSELSQEMQCLWKGSLRIRRKWS